MDSIKRKDGFIVSGLILLSVIPILGGTFRILELTGGADITVTNERFFADSNPVIIHIICSAIYCVLGAFQFSEGLRRKSINLHRASGRILVPLGFISAVSGLWMTQFYPFAHYDGYALYSIRLVVGTLMALFICLGVMAILKKRIIQHRAWMMRAYALGLGAGTQVFTQIPFFIFADIRGELARTVLMALGWLINSLVVESILWRKRKAQLVQASYA